MVGELGQFLVLRPNVMDALDSSFQARYIFFEGLVTLLHSLGRETSLQLDHLHQFRALGISRVLS